MKIADMHCDTISELYQKKKEHPDWGLRKNGLHLDLEKMKSAGYLVQNFALYTDLENQPAPFEYCMELVDLFYGEIEKNQDLIKPAFSYEDIIKNEENGKMSAVLTIEEGGVCLGKPALLRDFYRLGVRMMTLTWNYENELAYSHKRGENGFPISDTERGLKEKGIEFLEEMERLGMIVDVSHLNDAGIRDVIRYTKKPFVASHSNARSLCSHPRNLTDEMLREISERGGVAGINFCGAFLHPDMMMRRDGWDSRIADMVSHMEYMKQVGGIQCIGLGSDFDGIAGRLEMENCSQMEKLADAMKKAGFTASEIEAVFYKNVLRVYKEVL